MRSCSDCADTDEWRPKHLNDGVGNIRMDLNMAVRVLSTKIKPPGKAGSMDEGEGE